MQTLNLWLQAPCCEDCILSDPIRRGRLPDIQGEGWQVDILLHVGTALQIVELAEQCLQDDDDYAFECKKCQRALKPWNGDPIWVIEYHLEEHYGIELWTPGRVNPPNWLKKQIIHLYDRKCFCCGTEGDLHIDHVRPRSKGGDSAFRNLQPLCERCGNLKGESEPTEVEVLNPIYFTSPPSDGYEHLFW